MNYPEYRQLLAAVLASPKDDTPRLVLADWLQEHSCDERAEFIRVQCEFATSHEVDRRCPFVKEFSRPEPEAMPAERWTLNNCVCVGCKLIRRERRLLDLCRHCFSCGPMESVTISRGFVESVTCAGADWLRHADALLARHPVERVELTTMPGYFIFGDRFQLAGDPQGRVYTAEEVERRVNESRTISPRKPGWSTLTWVGVGARTEQQRTVSAALLALRWPGVTFTLPD